MSEGYSEKRAANAIKKLADNRYEKAYYAWGVMTTFQTGLEEGAKRSRQFLEKVDEERGGHAKRKSKEKQLFQRVQLARMQLEIKEKMGNMLITKANLGFGEHLQKLREDRYVIDDIDAGFEPAMYVDFTKSLQIKEHQVDEKELCNLLQERAVSLDLNREDIITRHRLLMCMIFQSKQIDKLRREVTDNADLFEACFGKRPESEVAVVQGPITLHFRCRSQQDYANASRHSTERSDKVSLYSAGLLRYLPTSPIPTCKFLSLEKDINSRTFNGRVVDLFKHEENHAYYSFLPPTQPIVSVLTQESPVCTALRYFRSGKVETDAANEILASVQGGTPTHRIQAKLSLKGERALYDFEEDARSIIYPKVVKRCRSDVRKLVNKAMDNILGDEYANIICKALSAVESLRRGNISDAEIVEIFIALPLQTWQIFAQDFLNIINVQSVNQIVHPE